MSKSIVRQALETRLSTWAAAQVGSPPVAYENWKFDKPTSGVWFECFLIPNSTVSREVTAEHQTLIGLFQVNIWEKKGEGLGDSEALAESLAQEFAVIPKTGVVSIDKPPHVGRTLLDDSGWIATPVLISYRYEA